MLASMDIAPCYYRPASVTECYPYPAVLLPNRNVSNFPDSVQNNFHSHIFHQWPWRAFAFASDLGIVAHLLKKPKWAGLGWLIAIPYYVASLASRPTAAQRKKEGLYQLTANGLFPFLEAHIGAHVGVGISKTLAAKMPLLSGRQSTLIFKGGGALLAMATFTPTVGDKLSDKILEYSKI